MEGQRLTVFSWWSLRPTGQRSEELPDPRSKKQHEHNIHRAHLRMCARQCPGLCVGAGSGLRVILGRPRSLGSRGRGGPSSCVIAPAPGWTLLVDRFTTPRASSLTGPGPTTADTAAGMLSEPLGDRHGKGWTVGAGRCRACGGYRRRLRWRVVSAVMRSGRARPRGVRGRSTAWRDRDRCRPLCRRRAGGSVALCARGAMRSRAGGAVARAEGG